MSRRLHQLTALTVTKAKAGRTLADGGNLYLQVNKSGAKYWIYRYMTAGKAKVYTIGTARLIPLADARQKATTLSLLRFEGVDPIIQRTATKAAAVVVQPTFRALAEDYIETHAAGWRNTKHAAQWTATLEQHVYPAMADTPADQVDRKLVLQVLRPIWTTIPTTASRVRQRIEAVLDFANGLGYRTQENPARWKGGLKAVLPLKSKVRKVRHFPALPHQEAPEVMRTLKRRDSLSSSALRFLILTATRTSETLLAEWTEIDLKKETWTIPSSRTKTHQDHTVPLSPQAVEILKHGTRVADSPYVFAHVNNGKPLSNMALLALRDRIGLQHITVHGFRSTFRNWAAENGYSRELAEMALSHAVRDKVEAAYLRTRMVECRRPLMAAWADFCNGQNDD